MPTIEEVDDFSDPDDIPLDLASAPPPPPPAAPKPSGPPPNIPGFSGQGQYQQVTPDMYKGWETIYPIYIDAKRPQQDGARRVNKTVALQWPLAEAMAQACNNLGVRSVYEPQKTHPKDWANPGRIRVLLKHEGKAVHPVIKNKRILLNSICTMLLPRQPKPLPGSTLPPIHLRLPAHSPAVSHGTLESAMKGGGMGGMLGNMLGGLGGGGGGEEDEKVEDQPVKKKEPPKLPKMKKVHARRR